MVVRPICDVQIMTSLKPFYDVIGTRYFSSLHHLSSRKVFQGLVRISGWHLWRPFGHLMTSFRQPGELNTRSAPRLTMGQNVLRFSQNCRQFSLFEVLYLGIHVMIRHVSGVCTPRDKLRVTPPWTTSLRCTHTQVELVLGMHVSLRSNCTQIILVIRFSLLENEFKMSY